MAKAGRKEEARRWISQAIFDLKGAEWNLKGGFFNTVCFLAGIPMLYLADFLIPFMVKKRLRKPWDVLRR